MLIFYDGQCPMCTAEMRHLKKYDDNDLIKLVDIHDDEFATIYPEISFNEAMRILHGYHQGELLLGLDVTYRAWTLVGKGVWVAPLNWPGMKTLSHWGYRRVAKHRLRISTCLSKCFGLKVENCPSGSCYSETSDINHRR